MRMLEYYGIDRMMCPVAVKEELRRGNISTPGQHDRDAGQARWLAEHMCFESPGTLRGHYSFFVGGEVSLLSFRLFCCATHYVLPGPGHLCANSQTNSRGGGGSPPLPSQKILHSVRSHSYT